MLRLSCWPAVDAAGNDIAAAGRAASHGERWRSSSTSTIGGRHE